MRTMAEYTFPTKPKHPSLKSGNPLAAVPYGRLEVAYLHNAHVLGPGARKFIAFGITGHGKSSFLNFLLKAKEEDGDRRAFSTNQGIMMGVGSVTKETQACPAMIGGEEWLLIDTPGFFDTDQLQEGIGESNEAQFKQQKKEFLSHIMRAFLEAGKEVSAFLLVYNGTARWAMEMSQQIKFLNSIHFPWSHCILVITHADAAFKAIPDEKRRYGEFIKAVTVSGDKRFPEQLKQLMRDTKNRVVLVDSLRKEDSYHESVVTRMKAAVMEIQEEHGKCQNELFAIFDKIYNADCHKVYMSLLRDDKGKLQQLVRVTEKDSEAFVRAGKRVAKDHSELIRMMEDIAQLADGKTLIALTKEARKGDWQAVGGMTLAIVSVIALPFTLGLSLISFRKGVAIYKDGQEIAQSALIKHLKATEEVKQAQSCLEQGHKTLRKLYSHYQSLLTEINEAGLNHHASSNDSLVAHLLAVHAHNAQERSPKLLQAARELSVFHTLRKAAAGELSPQLAEKISGNCALPIGFNILAATMDVAQTVDTALRIDSSTTKSTTPNSTLLRSSCIQTLRKECSAIKTLCNIHD